MPNMNVNFLGQTLVLPGAYYADNVSAALTPIQSNTPPLVFIGNFYGLAPKTPTTFTNVNDAINAVRGAPSAIYLQFMNTPSPVLFGAQYITLINASENTQSTNTLYATDGTTALIDLTSANYGAPSNLLQSTVAAGTIGGINLTLYDGYSNTSIEADNLGVPFSIAYTGAVSGVTASVSGSVSTGATNFILTSTGTGESFNIPLGAGGYQTIQQLVDYINGTGFYLAVMNNDDSGLASDYLEVGASISLPVAVSGVYTYKTVPAPIGDVYYWINQNASAFATATIASGIGMSATYSYKTTSATHFTGAQNVPPISSDYAAAFNVALKTPGWSVFADSNSQAIMALGAQHAETASTPLYGAWRRFVTGSSVGDSVSTTVQNATQLNSATSVFCYPGIYRTDTTTGINTLYGGLAVAASVAAIMAGNIVAQPLTNQALTGTGVEKAGGQGQYLSTSQINQLQQAGVLCIQPSTNNVPTIISDFTTWQQDSNPENVFTQQVACRWALAYSMQAAAQPFIGTIESPYGLALLKRALIKQLNNLVYSPGSNGVLVSWDTSSLKLTYTGATQSVSMSVNVVLVGQVRFILEQTFVQPLNLTA
ncbi:MAG: hypothetical protein KGI54_14985 [Pseudomonadota bacterium]|nr:hypothetical protein [Pseudomonadota bacterium]